MDKNIVKLNIDNTDSYVLRPIYECTTDADVHTKTIISCEGFEITNGSHLLINFSKGNTNEDISFIFEVSEDEQYTCSFDYDGLNYKWSAGVHDFVILGSEENGWTLRRIGEHSQVQSNWHTNDSTSSSFIEGRTHYYNEFSQIKNLEISEETVGTILCEIGTQFMLGDKVYVSEYMVDEVFNCASIGPSVYVRVERGDDGYILRHVSGAHLAVPCKICAAINIEQLSDGYIPDTIIRKHESISLSMIDLMWDDVIGDNTVTT